MRSPYKTLCGKQVTVVHKKGAVTGLLLSVGPRSVWIDPDIFIPHDQILTLKEGTPA